MRSPHEARLLCCQRSASAQQPAAVQLSSLWPLAYLLLQAMTFIALTYTCLTLRRTAMAVAAAGGEMRAECARVKAPHGSVFELFGLDFLVGSILRPGQDDGMLSREALFSGRW